MYKSLAHRHVCPPHACLVPTEARRICWIPRSGFPESCEPLHEYRELTWGSSTRAAVLWAAGPSLQPHGRILVLLYKWFCAYSLTELRRLACRSSSRNRLICGGLKCYYKCGSGLSSSKGNYVINFYWSPCLLEILSNWSAPHFNTLNTIKSTLKESNE